MVSFGWVREPEPASWLEGYTLPENPTLGQRLRGFEPVYPWDRPRPIPSETMISIIPAQGNALGNRPPAKPWYVRRLRRNATPPRRGQTYQPRATPWETFLCRFAMGRPVHNRGEISRSDQEDG